jgi:hypothetical protein
MNYNYKLRNILLLAGLLGLFIAGSNIQPGRTQTNLQELQNRVIELEIKLADAKALQEKAYNVQRQLEEQEQAFASLAKSDKYRLQIIEIRSGIKNIRTRIEIIVKEKNDLEENLRLAKNLQTILLNAQTTARPEAKTIPNQSLAKKWRIDNVHIGKYFSEDESGEITSFFMSGRQVNQDDILDGAYQIYNRTGISINVIVHSKSGDVADLDILLNQRVRANPNLLGGISMQTLDYFKVNHFNLMIKND